MEKSGKEEWCLYFQSSQWIIPLLATLVTLFYVILTEYWVKMRIMRLKVHLCHLPNHTVSRTSIGMTKNA